MEHKGFVFLPCLLLKPFSPEKKRTQNTSLLHLSPITVGKPLNSWILDFLHESVNVTRKNHIKHKLLLFKNCTLNDIYTYIISSNTFQIPSEVLIIKQGNTVSSTKSSFTGGIITSIDTEAGSLPPSLRDRMG